MFFSRLSLYLNFDGFFFPHFRFRRIKWPILVVVLCKNKQATGSWKEKILIRWRSEHWKIIPTAVCTCICWLREYFSVKIFVNWSLSKGILEPPLPTFQFVFWAGDGERNYMKLRQEIIRNNTTKLWIFHSILLRLKVKNRKFKSLHIIPCKSTLIGPLQLGVTWPQINQLWQNGIQKWKKLVDISKMARFLLLTSNV